MFADEGTTSDYALSPCGQGPCQPAGGKSLWGGKKATPLPSPTTREMGENVSQVKFQVGVII